jgi:cytochrome c oxidase subunit II
VSGLDRRQLLRLSAAAAGAAALGVARPQTTVSPRVIVVTARRFEFVPAEIVLKAGEAVVIAITSLDFVHGLNIPVLKQRFDLVPGRVTQVPLKPLAPGVIDFVCDNFCGDGHELMHGRFIVLA